MNALKREAFLPEPQVYDTGWVFSVKHGMISLYIPAGGKVRMFWNLIYVDSVVEPISKTVEIFFIRMPSDGAERGYQTQV